MGPNQLAKEYMKRKKVLGDRERSMEFRKDLEIYKGGYEVRKGPGQKGRGGSRE